MRLEATLERIVRRTARDTRERWYTGRIVRLNTDGTYAVLVNELNVVYPRLHRSGAERGRLLFNDRVQVRHRAGVLELL